MDVSEIALLSGGGVGVAVSLIHAVAMHHFVVRPIDHALAQVGKMTGGPRKLVTPLLNYSTFAWFMGGVTVIVAALTFGQEAQRAVGLLVGASYFYAGTANLCATRGKHPGGWLMALAVGLIGFGIT